MFVAVAGHEGHRRERFADVAPVDQRAAGLVRAAQKRVGRAAHAQAGFVRRASVCRASSRVTVNGFSV